MRAHFGDAQYSECRGVFFLFNPEDRKMDLAPTKKQQTSNSLCTHKVPGAKV